MKIANIMYRLSCFSDYSSINYNKDDVIKINEILKLMGYRELNTMVNEFNRSKVEKMIAKDLEVKVEPVKEEVVKTDFVNKPRPKKIETVLDERVVLGKVIDDEIININDIVGENEDIAIEGEIFGVEGFESVKSDFKIITLKVTDYSSSIYAKVFTRSKEEYQKYLSIFKEGTWFKFYGYTKYDQFSRGDLVFNIQSINYSIHQKEEIKDLEEEKKRLEEWHKIEEQRRKNNNKYKPVRFKK